MTPELTLVEQEEPQASTLDDLRAELAALQADAATLAERDAEDRRAATLRTWEAARERAAKELAAKLSRSAQELAAGRFDPTGLGDLLAAVSPTIDKAMRARIEELRHSAPTLNGRDHPSNRAADLSMEIARLEDEERRMARMRRNTTRQGDR